MVRWWAFLVTGPGRTGQCPIFRSSRVWCAGAVNRSRLPSIGAVFAGGCLGTAGRMGILHLVGDQVVALAAVNLLGCLLLGVVSALLGHRHEAWRMFLVVGGIGAFTSWSSLAVQGATHPSGVLIVAAEALAGVCVAGLAHFATWRLMMRGSR